MEHDPLGHRHDGFLCVIQRGQFGLDRIVCVRHVREADLNLSRCRFDYLRVADLRDLYMKILR